MIKRIRLIMKNGSLIKSIIYNFKYLAFRQAIRLPLIIAKSCSIKGKGNIKIPSDKNLKIYIGQKSLQWDSEKRNYTHIFLEGTLEFKRNVFIGLGTKIEVNENAYLILGENLTITGNSKIICKNYIEFGKDNLISWDTLFLDSDGHTIVSNKHKNYDGKIVIGDHVWIGSNCTLKKNTFIPNNIVIASNSVVNGKYEVENTILAGNIAKIVKENINWSIDIPEKGN